MFASFSRDNTHLFAGNSMFTSTYLIVSRSSKALALSHYLHSLRVITVYMISPVKLVQQFKHMLRWSGYTRSTISHESPEQAIV